MLDARSIRMLSTSASSIQHPDSSHVTPCERTSNGSYSASFRSHQSIVRCSDSAYSCQCTRWPSSQYVGFGSARKSLELRKRLAANRLNLLDIGHDL